MPVFSRPVNRIAIDQTCRLLLVLLAAPVMACELVPFCEDPGQQHKCVSGDESTEGDTSIDVTGDGDGDGDTTGDGETIGDGDGEPADDVPELALSYSQVKQFEFTWTSVAGAEFYRLFERENPEADYTQIGADVTSTAMSSTTPLHRRVNASYFVQACNDLGCVDSAAVEVNSMIGAIGYFKASNTDPNDTFGWGLALSADGNTLAVGAPGEQSNATNIAGNQADNSVENAGAVYIFVRDEMRNWSQHSYVKASNTTAGDTFGYSVALSSDGLGLAVGARSADVGSKSGAGAVYVFARDQMGPWAQQAYIYASNPDSGDAFGLSVALSADGTTLAVGASGEASNATGINGNQTYDGFLSAGAVYVFGRDEMDVWTQQAYVKASNTGWQHFFGESVALSAGGNTLAVGARGENGAGDFAGAVYVFVRDDMATWSQHALIKASNAEAHDAFGSHVALSDDGQVLVVGAPEEDSSATGVGGDQMDNSASSSGAVYVFIRDAMGPWSQQAYIKASVANQDDDFGHAVALSGDGTTIVVGALRNASNAMGLDGDPTDNSVPAAGAVYAFFRDDMNAWGERAYVKASNTQMDDFFGWSVAVSGDGLTLAVGAIWEDGNATHIGGDATDNSAENSGGVYLY